VSWWDVKAALDGRRNLVRTIYTMPGTGADCWSGPPADIGRAVGDRHWFHQPVAYPAAPYPMDKSVNAGVAEHVRLIKLRNPSEEWCGVYYSQSAIVWYHIYQMMLPGGDLEAYMPSWKCTVTFGNPCREANVANGNAMFGWPMPTGRGIAPYRFVNTDPRQLDFAHPGDMYTDTPLSDAGDDITAIYNVVFEKWFGTGSLTSEILEVVKSPLKEIPAMVFAVFDALKFYASGPPTLQHINYDIGPAIEYLSRLGEMTPVA